MVWSPDGKFLASLSTDHTVRVWEVETGQCLKTLIGHQGWVLSAVWNPLSRSSLYEGAAGLVASSGQDLTLKIWDVHGRCLRTLSGHNGWVWSVSWSPVEIDLPSGIIGQLLASVGSLNDMSVRLWNLEGECLNILSGHQSFIWWVIWSPDGQQLASAGNDRTTKLWDVQTGECFNTLHDDRLLRVAIAWSPNGNWLASGSDDRTIKLWWKPMNANTR